MLYFQLLQRGYITMTIASSGCHKNTAGGGGGGAGVNIQTSSYQYRITMFKLRRSRDRLIYNMGSHTWERRS